MIRIPSRDRSAQAFLCIVGATVLMCGAFIFASASIPGAIVLASIEIAAFTLLSKKMKSRWPLVSGVTAVGIIVFALAIAVVRGQDPVLVAQAALFGTTGFATGRLDQTRSDYINVRITRLENCVQHEDSPAINLGADKAGCIKNFVGPVDREGLKAAKKSRASGDMVAAQNVLERIYREPLFRNADSAAYPDFVTWWKRDAGFHCGHDMNNGPAVTVLVYCLGSRPDVVRSFCGSERFNTSRYGEPMLEELCGLAQESEAEELARDAFAYCFAGTCLFPDPRRGAAKPVDPLV